MAVLLIRQQYVLDGLIYFDVSIHMAVLLTRQFIINIYLNYIYICKCNELGNGCVWGQYHTTMNKHSP